MKERCSMAAEREESAAILKRERAESTREGVGGENERERL
jgi:hypothetical protein